MSYQLLTQIMIPLLCYAQGRLSILVLQTRVGSGPQEQPHALALVLDDAVVQRGVALSGLLVQHAGVLDDEVDDVVRAVYVTQNDEDFQKVSSKLLTVLTIR